MYHIKFVKSYTYIHVLHVLYYYMHYIITCITFYYIITCHIACVILHIHSQIEIPGSDGAGRRPRGAAPPRSSEQSEMQPIGTFGAPLLGPPLIISLYILI